MPGPRLEGPFHNQSIFKIKTILILWRIFPNPLTDVPYALISFGRPGLCHHYQVSFAWLPPSVTKLDFKFVSIPSLKHRLSKIDSLCLSVCHLNLAHFKVCEGHTYGSMELPYD